MKEITLEAKKAAEGIKQQKSDDKEIRICITGLLEQHTLADITDAIEKTYDWHNYSVVLDLSGTTGLTILTSAYDGEKLGYCPPVRELVLPASIESLDRSYGLACFHFLFPTLQAFSVVPENESFVAVDGVLYTKNMTTLYAWPNNKFVRGDFIVPDGVKKIGGGAFADCKGYFDNIIFPNTLLEIGDYAFEGGSFRELILPEGVRKIGDNAFSDTHVARITFPKTLKFLGDELFFGEQDLPIPEISYTGSKAEWQDFFHTYLINKNFIFSVKNNNCSTCSFEGTSIHCTDGNFVIKETYDIPVNELTLDGADVKNKVSSLKGLWKTHVTGLFTEENFSDLLESSQSLSFWDCRFVLDLSATNGLILKDFDTFEKIIFFEEVILPDSLDISEIECVPFMTNLSFSPVVFSAGPGSRHFTYVDDTLYTKDMSTIIACFSKKDSFTVPDGVTKICKYAFSYSRIDYLSLPDSLNSAGEYAFGLPETDEKFFTGLEWDPFIDEPFPKISEINFAGTIDKFLSLNSDPDGSFFVFDLEVHCSDGDIEYPGVQKSKL